MARLAESALVKLDRSLLSALVDRWRPETHVPPPLWGDGTDPAGRCDAAWSFYHRRRCRAPRGTFYVAGGS